MPSNTPGDGQVDITTLQAERSRTRGLVSNLVITCACMKSADGPAGFACVYLRACIAYNAEKYTTSRECPEGEFSWYNSILTGPE